MISNEMLIRPEFNDSNFLDLNPNGHRHSLPTFFEATSQDGDTIPQYKPFYQIKDSLPTRATCFHPNGDAFVVGSNSKTLRVCMYPSDEELKSFTLDTPPSEPQVAFQFLQIHRGSVYCAGFNGAGSLLATGSNDQTVHLIKYNTRRHVPEGSEYKLTMHSGTVRDLCFMNSGDDDDSTLLATAGAGDYEICITDCNTMKPVRMLHGHESTIMSLHHWGEPALFVSGSLDGTMRMWDARSKLCAATITTKQALSVGVVRVEPTGKLLVSGHVDGHCMLYDIRGARTIQMFKAHEDEIRTVNFSPNSYYLLTAGYDRKVKLMDLQGDLTQKLPGVEIAELYDKAVQTAWHPYDYTFVTTSADGSTTLWTMPEVTTPTSSG